jgi:hypothetical protein
MYTTWKEHAFMKKLMLLAVITTLLTGCVSSPTRTDVEAFTIAATGVIEPKNVQAFTDCLMDGFDKAHWILTSATTRQQRRSNSYRVESFAGGDILLISVDVFDDGNTRLFESKSAALVNTSGERAAFGRCLEKFTTNK